MAKLLTVSILAIALCFLAKGSVLGFTFSTKLIHRYSLEAAAEEEQKSSNGVVLPERKSLEYAERLLSSDMKRQGMKFGSRFQNLFPSEGSLIRSFGNELSWLHYTWIDVGNPNVSLLVALDVGSDLFWVPCECILCAAFSASQYTVLDRDLSEYQPSKSSTVKNMSCSHSLCASSKNCKNPDDLCPYVIEYASENTSSSGYLVQESLHLTSVNKDASANRVQASVVMGCGRKQSGSFLSGAAPDGLMGLGPGGISVPSLLSKAGFIRNSFSICFNNDDSGRLLFGDQGPDSQQSTPFLTTDGSYDYYFVRVESCCVGSTCLKQSGFRAQVDTGSSFTYLTNDVLDKVVSEFDKLNFKRTSPQRELPNCYTASQNVLANIPTLKLMFAKNQSFSIGDYVISPQLGVVCLTILQSNQDYSIIGQNSMTGHLMVFDRENLRLGWSHSDCRDPSNRTSVDISPPSPGGSSQSPLPASEERSNNNDSQAISPVAIPISTSPKSSTASHLNMPSVQPMFYPLLLLVCLVLTS